MSNGEIDRLQVNQLVERYDLVRSAVYSRMEALGIKPKKVGKKAYVSAEQIQLLDQLHQFIQGGGTTAEFLEMRGLRRTDGQPAEPSSEPSSGLSPTQSGDMMRLVAAITKEITREIFSELQFPAPEADPFEYFRTLDEAARNGWLLKTSEVAFLLDLRVSEIQMYGDRFSEAGYVFTREGYRTKGEVAWRVSKLVR